MNELEKYKTTPLQKLGRYKSLIIFAVIMAVLPFLGFNQYGIHVLIMMLFWAYMATSWSVLGGKLGHFAMGNGIYMALGAYITGALYKYGNMTPWLGIILAGILSAVIAVIVSLPCFRLRGTYYSLATTAVLFIGKTLIVNNQFIFGLDFGGSLGFRIAYNKGFMNMAFKNKEPYYFIILGMFVIAMFVMISLNYNKTGYYFSAIKTNQEAAEAAGVNTTLYKCIGQAICTFFTAAGGGFYMMFIMFLDPSRILVYALSIEILLYAVVGGMATTWGPAIGAIILYPLSEVLRVTFSDTGSLSKAIYALIFMLVVFFAPQGVQPALAKLLDKIGVTGFFAKIKSKLFKKTAASEEVE